MKSTPDLCDEFEKDVRVINLPLKNFGKIEAFGGEIVTVKCFNDNSKVKQALEEDGSGKVLVVDGGGSMNRALLGDQVAKKAMHNKWSGVIIYGPIRDCEVIAGMKVGVKALGTHPMKTEKKNRGDINQKLKIAGEEIHPGHFIYADQNGVIVSEHKLPA